MAEGERAQVHAWVREHTPRLSNAAVGELLQPRRVPDLWTAEDERRLNDTDDRVTVDDISKDMAILWQLCTRFWKQLPPQLVSKSNYLQYNSTDDLAPYDLALDLDWDDEFCHSLSQLIVHPVWQEQKWFLIACLQLAVICRTDDRREWPLALNKTPEPFCDCLLTIKSKKAGVDIGEIFSAVQSFAAQAQVAPTIYSVLMTRLVSDVVGTRQSSASRAIDPITKGDFSSRPYALKRQDLQNLLNVIGTLDTAGYVMFYDPQTILQYTREAVVLDHGSNREATPSRATMSLLMSELYRQDARELFVLRDGRYRHRRSFVEDEDDSQRGSLNPASTMRSPRKRKRVSSNVATRVLPTFVFGDDQDAELGDIEESVIPGTQPPIADRLPGDDQDMESSRSLWRSSALEEIIPASVADSDNCFANDDQERGQKRSLLSSSGRDTRVSNHALDSHRRASPKPNTQARPVAAVLQQGSLVSYQALSPMQQSSLPTSHQRPGKVPESSGELDESRYMGAGADVVTSSDPSEPPRLPSPVADFHYEPLPSIDSVAEARSQGKASRETVVLSSDDSSHRDS